MSYISLFYKKLILLIYYILYLLCLLHLLHLLYSRNKIIIKTMMSIFKRKQKGPPSYDTISIPPSYNEVVQLPSYEELIGDSESRQSNKKVKFDHKVNDMNDNNCIYVDLIKQLYTRRDGGSCSYMVIKDMTDIKFNVKDLIMEVVRNKHTSITIYNVTNNSDIYCIFKINNNKHLVKGNSKLIVLGFDNTKIEVGDITIYGNKFGSITPNCNISIESSTDNKIISSCVYTHLDYFLIK